MLTNNKALFNLTLPEKAKDSHYYIKICVRSEGREKTDVFDVCDIYLYHIMPMKEVLISYDGDNPVLADDGIILSCEGTMMPGYEALFKAEYRFLYQLDGAKKWRYISSKFSEQLTTLYMPKNEGIYRFKVEARSIGRKTIDAALVLEDTVGLYFDYLPARHVEISTGESTSFVYGEAIPINISAVGNGTIDEKMEYKILYSTNNKRFKTTIEYQDFQPLDLIDGKTDVMYMLPIDRYDRPYYIKIVIRTRGRQTIDQTDNCVVDMYVAKPD